MFYPLSIQYDEPLFRPPSEADSLILQATIGCSWNRCTFCEMYTSKRFRPRREAELFEEIRRIGEQVGRVRRVFLADGDAMTLSTRRLMRILEQIHRHIDGVQRVSCYALPRQLARKSADELKELCDAGLKLVYVGVESGDDEVLRRVRKGETRASSIAGLQKAQAAGIDASVMILNGLGGVTLAEQHARNSARVLNETQPRYAAVLVVMFPKGERRFVEAFGDDYVAPDLRHSLLEMQTFIESTRLENTIFRSDHASNHLVLKGVLGRDKGKLLARIAEALRDPSLLRPHSFRGL
ncbi:MAG: radical SAM protein [Gammaproteobacteria bacterium]